MACRALDLPAAPPLTYIEAGERSGGPNWQVRSVGTIARQLRVHRDTVRSVLDQACVMRIERQAGRPSRVDPYLPFMRETLAKFPVLTASRLHTMVQSRGYAGSTDYFLHIVARHRPRPPAEAYLRLRTLPGEQMQIDWGHFGHQVFCQARVGRV